MRNSNVYIVQIKMVIQMFSPSLYRTWQLLGVSPLRAFNKLHTTKPELIDLTFNCLIFQVSFIFISFNLLKLHIVLLMLKWQNIDIILSEIT